MTAPVYGVAVPAHSRASDRILEALERHGSRVKKQHGYWMAQCPTHPDSTESLSVRQYPDSASVHCFADCDRVDVMAAIGLTPADHYDTPGRADYSYTDRTGTRPGRIVHRQVDAAGKKSFRQSGDTKSQPTLYRLPKVLAAVEAGTTVYVVEGEKDVHALESLGAVATTAPMGAGNWGKVDTGPLKAAHVVVVPDQDGAGERWTRDVLSSLHGLATTVEVGSPRVGKDAEEHVSAGYTLGELDPHPAAAADDPFLAAADIPAARLQFQTVAELCAEVDAMGPRRYLVRGLWPAGAYGVHAAEPKAGKTWNGLDLAVAVAAGQPFLGKFEVDTQGPVIVFAGEGGKGSVVRRLRAVAAAHGVRLEDLPITVCCRAPHLSDEMVRAEFRARLAADRPVLVVLDPLYLAARGAKLGDVYAMGELLEGPQHDCEAVGASLFVVTHFNRKEGRGASRITGAGPAEWGRVLLSTAVLSKRTDPATKTTTVVTETDVIGGEVPDLTFRIRRTVAADDPDDLDSPLRYEVEVMPADEQATVDDGMPPAQRAVLASLRAETAPVTVRHLQDVIGEQRIAEGARPLRRETVAKALAALADLGLADAVESTPGSAGLWLAKGCAL